MMKYSGNIDAVVPTYGTLGWILSLNQTITNDWRQFLCPSGQVGGWIQDFSGLTFVSINGAGHMVPGDKPEAIKYVIDNWINNKPI